MNLFLPSSILILSYFTLILAPFCPCFIALSESPLRIGPFVFPHRLWIFFFPNDPLLLSPLLLPQTPTFLFFFIVNAPAESRTRPSEQLWKILYFEISIQIRSTLVKLFTAGGLEGCINP